MAERGLQPVSLSSTLGTSDMRPLGLWASWGFKVALSPSITSRRSAGDTADTAAMPLTWNDRGGDPSARVPILHCHSAGIGGVAAASLL
ncbi:hypothetical protein ColTof3_14339 [Colletotrichum tofieldiae]|nr:hypothetical protein ColTof3_14339 [Colletotrichum tofieldiae]